MNKTKIKVDGIEQEREVDYSVRRGFDEYRDYPKIKNGEHFYENAKELIIFTQKSASG